MASIDSLHQPVPSVTQAVAGVLSNSAARLPWPAFIYLICVVVPVWFYAGPLFLSILRLFLLVTTLPLLVRLLMGRYGPILPVDILFLLHLCWAAIALVVNNPNMAATQIGSVGPEFLGGYLMGRAYIRSEGVFLKLCQALVVVVLVSLPFALYEALTGRPLIVEFISRLPSMTSVEVVTIEGRMGLERVQGMFAHPIHFGLFCSVAFSLAFVGLKGHGSTFWRWISSSIIALCGFLALSSGALLAIFLQLGLILWAALFDSIRWRWWLLLGLFALAYVAVDILSNRSAIEVFMSYATFSAHNAYWRAQIFEWGMANLLGSAEKGIVGSPIFGIGLNDWVRPWYMYSGSMDNFWLVMAVRYGSPALIFLGLGYIWSLAKVMRRDFDASLALSQIRRAWVFTFVGLTFTLCTVHVWTSIYSFVFFVFGSGLWLIEAKNSSNAREQVPGSSGPEHRKPRYSRFATVRTRSARGVDLGKNAFAGANAHYRRSVVARSVKNVATAPS